MAVVQNIFIGVWVVLILYRISHRVPKVFRGTMECGLCSGTLVGSGIAWVSQNFMYVPLVSVLGFFAVVIVDYYIAVRNAID